MTSNSSVQLTPGQRCLLDLLQRKLLNTIQSYAKLSLESFDSGDQSATVDELQRLKDRIRRISARQKRFTLEIINGNGNNTIPKESFFQALGLVTKEALNKLNSKTNERRRRTTANPRFSHEAIQAKRALEPLQRRLEPRVSKDRRESARKLQRQQQPNSGGGGGANNIINTNSSQNTATANIIDNNSPHITANNNNININNNNNNSNNVVDQQSTNNGAKGGGGCGSNGNGNGNGNNNNNNSTITNSRSSSRAASNTSGNELANQKRHQTLQNETRNLVVQYNDLERQISAKVNQIKSKRENNRRLEKQNELIRKRGLDIISAINILNPNFQVSASDDNGQHLNDLVANSQQNNTGQGDQTTQSAEPLDIWIDMKCDESLDGLD